MGKQTLQKHKQNLVCTRTQEKGAVSPQETEPDLPVSVQDSPESGSLYTGALSQGHWTQQCGHKSFKRQNSGQTTVREHSPDHQQKIGLKIYWTWPCPSEQDLNSPTVILAHQETSISIYPYPSEGRQNENRKLNKLITWITALYNSIKLWAMPG